MSMENLIMFTKIGMFVSFAVTLASVCLANLAKCKDNDILSLISKLGIASGFVAICIFGLYSYNLNIDVNGNTSPIFNTIIGISVGIILAVSLLFAILANLVDSSVPLWGFFVFNIIGAIVVLTALSAALFF